jgi:serine/threonine protein kinase
VNLASVPGGGPLRVTCPRCGRTFAMRRGEASASEAGSPAAGGAAAAGVHSDSTSPGVSLAPVEPPAPHELTGRIGPYEIVEVLGRGGMGVVYKARDTVLDRWVALKTLLSAMAGDREAHARFLREARSAAALSHPNLAQIYSIGEERGMPYFAMEYIEGSTLEQRLERRGCLRPLETVRLIRQVANGLLEAHRVQLIHRDIKPSNLILAHDGTLKITDFGLAKRAHGGASLQITQTGEAIGSPQYMSPEQVRGADLDHRSDIYSLGATFFHLLTGRPPFQGDTPVEVAMKHLQETAPSPRTLVPEISYPLSGLVQRMLRKRPEDRPAGYPALIQELDRIEALETGRAQEPEAVPLWVRERSSSSWASFLGFLALCLAAGFMGYRMVRGIVANPQASPAGQRSTPALEVEATDSAGDAPVRERDTRRSGWPSRIRQRNQPSRRALEPRRSPLGEPQLRLRDLVHSSLPPSGTRVEGRIVNRGEGPATGVLVNLKLYDEDGLLIESRRIHPDRDILEGGQGTRFEAEFEDVSEVTRVEAELSWTY